MFSIPCSLWCLLVYTLGPARPIDNTYSARYHIKLSVLFNALIIRYRVIVPILRGLDWLKSY